MLWEIEIQPKGDDAERRRVVEEYDLLTHTRHGAELIAATARGYLIEGEVSRPQAKRLADELLVDPLIETGRLGTLNEHVRPDHVATVLLKPGVMDPTALSVVEAARDLGIHVESGAHFPPLLRSPACAGAAQPSCSARYSPTRPSNKSSPASDARPSEHWFALPISTRHRAAAQSRGRRAGKPQS